MAERRVRNAEVRGSIPLCSTNNTHRFNDLLSLTFVLVQCGGQGLEPTSARPTESSTYGDRGSSRFPVFGLWRQVDVIDRGPQSLVRPRSDVKAESMQRAEIVFITPRSSFESSPATNFSNSLNQLPASWQFGAGFKIAFLL